jgi:type I restriction-modification system, M subunit
MEGNEYKDYLLGLIFYRYLSEKIVLFVDNELKEDNLTYEQV